MILYNQTLAFLFLLLFTTAGYSKKNNRTPIEILNADKLIREQSSPDINTLLGNVSIKHEGILITCDKAILYSKKCFLQAEGHVIANQSDSTFLNSDYLEYDCKAKTATAKHNVLLKTTENQLNTDTLKLFRLEDLAIFDGGGILTNNEGLNIKCKKGSNNLKTKIYNFENDVVMNQDSTLIYTNLATYNPIDSTLTTHARTIIIQNEKDTLIFDHGLFNNLKSIGHGTGNVEGFHNNNQVTTDSVSFNKNTGIITLFKNSIVIDSTGKNKLEGNFIQLFKNKDSIFAANDPYYLYKDDSSSIEFTADTLISKKTDFSETVYGYGHARFFNPNFASLSNMMYLNNFTKRLYLYGDPILWTKKGAQLTADTLIITFKEIIDSKTKEKQLQPDSLFALYNTFLIEQKPEYFGYNQAKGEKANGLFKEGKLDYLQLLDSCKTIYYYKTEEDLIINFSKTDTVEASFKKGKIYSILQKGNNKGKLSPIKIIEEKDTKLKGFNPFFSLKAFNKNDIKQTNLKPRIIDTVLLKPPSLTRKNLHQTE